MKKKCDCNTLKNGSIIALDKNACCTQCGKQYPIDFDAEIENPKDKAQQRKASPIFSGVLKYFPNALWYISQVSQAGNDQHHKGQPLHWDRSKSTDEADALTRHLIQSGTIDDDGIRHSGKMAWRALALLEKELEKDNETFI